MRIGQTLSAVNGPGRFVVLQTGNARELPKLNGRSLVLALPVPCSALRPPGPPRNLEAGHCYTDERTGLELRCTESADGALQYAGRLMTRLPPRRTQLPAMVPGAGHAVGSPEPAT
jgi:hypothetical protein